MSSLSRNRIFTRLNAARRIMPVPLPGAADISVERLGREARVEKLKTLMKEMRTEVHIVKTESFMESLTMILKNKGIKELLYSPEKEIGTALEECRKDDISNLPELIVYGDNFEEFKPRLFEVQASITSTAGAIADTGAIILCPDEKEPRLMSLVPPIHIAVLAAEKIYNSLSEVIHSEGWSKNMPTNLLLISGPSKTADIELTLAFGVHGPKELILFIVEE